MNDAAQNGKTCKKCGTILVIGEGGNWAAYRVIRRHRICNECHRVWMAAWRSRNRQRVNARAAEWKRLNPGKSHHSIEVTKLEVGWSARLRLLALSSADNRRRKGRNIVCKISKEEIEQLGSRQGMRCYFTGTPFYLIGGRKHPLYPSLDRQDSDGDYTLDNCRLVCWWVNRARSNDSPQTFVENLKTAFESFATAPCHAELGTLFEPKKAPADPHPPLD